MKQTWKGSSVKGYSFASGPVHLGSSSVPAAIQLFGGSVAEKRGQPRAAPRPPQRPHNHPAASVPTSCCVAPLTPTPAAAAAPLQSHTTPAAAPPCLTVLLLVQRRLRRRHIEIGRHRHLMCAGGRRPLASWLLGCSGGCGRLLLLLRWWQVGETQAGWEAWPERGRSLKTKKWPPEGDINRSSSSSSNTSSCCQPHNQKVHINGVLQVAAEPVCEAAAL